MKLLSPKGRTSRFEFLIIILGVSLLELIVSFSVQTLESEIPFYIYGSTVLYFSVIISFLTALIGIFAVIKRLHDMCEAWYNIFILLIPAYNIVLVFFLLFTPGSKGQNKYGPDPVKELKKLKQLLAKINVFKRKRTLIPMLR